MQAVTAASPLTQPSKLRHHRRFLKPVGMTYLFLIPLALVIAGTAPHRGDYRFFIEVVLWHMACCVMVALLVKLLLDSLELFRCGRRLRIRGRFFLKLLALWPLAVCVTMVILKAVGAA